MKITSVIRHHPHEVSFTHTAWGKYQVIGFMADKYFAGYIRILPQHKSDQARISLGLAQLRRVSFIKYFLMMIPSEL